MRKFLFAITALLSLNAGAKDYFQQEVNYKIDVRLDDKKHELHGYESIEYINKSPDALSYIYIHLWPNAYKENSTALGKQLTEAGELDFHFAKKEERGYIDSLDFKVDGQSVKVESEPGFIDICRIMLSKPLNPGERITITTPFHVKIPVGKFSRLGHMDEAYQITQWYPKPAVYDNNGWNQIPYLNQGEFYSEFGTYDVKITLPRNYVVGATGDLVDGEKELAWLEEKVHRTKSISKFDTKDLAFPPSDAEFKTLHYHQEKVHDFAWFADKRYHVLKGEVELPHSKKKVTTWTMFTNGEADLWAKSIEYMNDAIYYYSLWNGDYPYNHATAVDGALSAGGGMEYPNVTVIGRSGSAFMLEVVIVHEVGHNWFYGILGSNERLHPWMDEGMNSWNELRYVRKKYPEKKLLGESGLTRLLGIDHMKQKAQYELGYIINAKRNLDQPVECPAHHYTELNYGGIVYMKSAIIFDYLRSYLGDQAFDKAMQAYFDEWKFRHPSPVDLRRSIEVSTGKKLDWFFDDLVGTTKKVDFKISRVYNSDKGYPVATIKNKGDIKSPVMICGITDGKMRSSIWYDTDKAESKTMEFALPPGNYDKVVIDHPGDIPEISRKNNTYKMRGLFKKTEPLKLQLFGSIENPKRTQLFYTPLLGFNDHDGLMAGLAVYNHAFPERKFKYTFAPMFGLENKKVVGFAQVAQNFYPDATFQNIEFGINARSFSTHEFFKTANAEPYYKVSPFATFEFKKKRARSSMKSTISVRTVFIKEPYHDLEIIRLADLIKPPTPHYRDFTYHQLSYSFVDSRKLNPYNFKLTLESNIDEYTKAFGEVNHHFSYNGKKGIDIRLFAGGFIEKTNDLRYALDFNYLNGFNDYLFDHLYLGRNSGGFYSHQFVEKDGGFKHYQGGTYSNKFLSALNIKAAIPGGLPLFVYTSVGYSAGSDRVFPFGSFKTKGQIAYETGAAVRIVKNICEIYFPITTSNWHGDYFDNVRFTLNLHLLDPFSFVKNFSL